MVRTALWTVGLGLAAVSGDALADPVALRHAGPAGGLVVDAGWPDVSAAWWLSDRLGVGVAWRLPASAVSGAVGLRRRKALGGSQWAVDLYGAAGVLVPTVDPGLALTATPAVRLGRDARLDFGLGLAVPVELPFLGERRLRAPVLAEATVGYDFGPVEAGVRVGAGPVINLPGPPSVAVRSHLWLRLPVDGLPHR